MYLNINHIEISGERLPIRMDNLIIQKIQERYGTMTEFEMKLMGWKAYKDENGKEEIKIAGEPSMELINWVLPELVKEGYIVEFGEECPHTDEDINRMVDVSPVHIANMIHDEMLRAFERKKKENRTTETEKTAETRKRTEKLTSSNSIWRALGTFILRKRS